MHQRSQCNNFMRPRLRTQRSEIKQQVRINDESFVGTILKSSDGLFQIKCLRFQSDGVDIYQVTDVGDPFGSPHEAKVFVPIFSDNSLGRRKQMTKRIRNSQNYRGAAKKFGNTYFISQVERSDAEIENLASSGAETVACCEAFFQAKCQVSKQSEPERKIQRNPQNSVDCPHDGAVIPRTNLTYAEATRAGLSQIAERPKSNLLKKIDQSDPAARQNGGHQSYAAVLASGLSIIPRSTTSKGIRQRKRRQRRQLGKAS
jgi:hypothetical protein